MPCGKTADRVATSHMTTGVSANGWSFWHRGSLDGPSLYALRARVLASRE